MIRAHTSDEEKKTHGTSEAAKNLLQVTNTTKKVI